MRDVRRSPILIRLLAIAVLVASATGWAMPDASSGPAEPLSYQPMVDLGTLGGRTSVATDVNDAGVVVGWSTLPGEAVTHAFAVDPVTREMRDLGSLGGDRSQAFGVNNQGVVVGASRLAGSNEEHAFSYDLSSGVMTDLGSDGQNSAAHAITDDGTIVGAVEVAGQLRAAVREPGVGAWRELDEPAGEASLAADINALGLVVGQQQHMWAPASSSAVSWMGPDGPLTDLGTLGGHYGAANGVNHSGTIVGNSTLHPASDSARPFVVPAGSTTMADPGVGYPGHATAHDVNDQNLMVGGAAHEGSFSVAYVHDLDRDVTTHLGTLGGVQSEAFAIRADGTVVGSSEYSMGASERHAFVVAPDRLSSPSTTGVARCGANEISWTRTSAWSMAPEAFVVWRDDVELATVDGQSDGFVDEQPTSPATYTVVARQGSIESAPSEPLVLTRPSTCAAPAPVPAPPARPLPGRASFTG